MTREPFSGSEETPAFPAPPPQGLGSRVFLGPHGLRSGWSLLLYGAFFLMIEYALEILVVVVRGFGGELRPPETLALQELISFLSAYVAALLMARLEGRPADVYGLPLRHAFGNSFWLGMVLGLGEVSMLVGLIAVFGGYSFGMLAIHGSALWGWGVFWAVAFVLVGLSEEFFFRGYTQSALARGVGFWPAAVCLSLIFGAAHLRNAGERIVGAVNVAATGLLFAFALRRTGDLWLAVGWHASFDFGETFLFSVPNSGFLFDHHLSNAVLAGKPWLTGGSVGPEGSVFSFVTLGISALLLHFIFPAKKGVVGNIPSKHADSVDEFRSEGQPHSF
ncbi:MAG TPA: CPBP family intramembrane glutamic endopeptidase [Candidatus Dormibacteraeota bacterium]|nr:CPBP family intramembrane glutamic endopeptidase [Candidatus Dormibacteraeota bacterium]